MVPLEGDHPANVYPDAELAVTVVEPIVRVLPDDENDVPDATVTDVVLTDPPADGDFAIVTTSDDPCVTVMFAVVVICAEPLYRFIV